MLGIGLVYARYTLMIKLGLLSFVINGEKEIESFGPLFNGVINDDLVTSSMRI